MAPNGQIPESEIVYAIGDIHGRDDLLGDLHKFISDDISKNGEARIPTVVYLGDYVDRGPGSRAVLDRLIKEPIAGAQSIHLKGNHEDAMLRFLDAQSGGEQWLSLGGGATAMSYGVKPKVQRDSPASLEVLRAELCEAIPASHQDFLRQLRLTHQVGDYLFVHAGIRPGLPLVDQNESDLLWIRREFLQSRRKHEKIVVHGHASGHKVVVKRNRICVDTAAYATDRLTCVILEGTTRRFLSTVP
jgi:serine/threonine protein phosphatase 1